MVIGERTGERDYEYRGMIARYWDLLRGDTSGWPDRAFYRDLIVEHGEPALDVGCGTGRLLLDYLGQGLDVDGVDDSPEMLAICRDKARTAGLDPTLYQQSMHELSLPRRYRVIVVPSSSFQLMVDPDEALAALTAFRNHLQPGGVLVMALMTLCTPDDPEDTGWRLVGEAERPEDGHVRRWSRSRYDRRAQLEHTEDRYEIEIDGAVVDRVEYARSPATRWYTQEQARQLLEAVGYDGIRVCRGFTAQPARPSNRIFTIFGSR